MKRCQRLVGLLTAVAVCSASVGCSATFWRRQADRDAYQTIAATLDDPQIAVPRFDITPDPSSRFFDPNPLDKSPLPPDDPTAHQYMNAVDGWRGYNGWHRNGQSLVVENPQWYANIGLDPVGFNEETSRYEGDGELPELSIEDAVNLALIHGRTYQQAIEDVFTAALTVSARQFGFGVRYFSNGTTEPEYNLNAVLRPGQTRVDQLNQVANFGIRRLLPSGATIAVGLANSTMWFFTGGDGTDSIPALTYGITQPLLAAGGRKIVLEDLTQDQRTLLYELRNLARFRREYFTDVVATQSGGYLGLLQQVQTIRNQIDNIERLERQLDILRAQASQKPGRPRAALASLPLELGTATDLNIPDSIRDDFEYDENTRELIWSDSRISDEDMQLLLGLSDNPEFRVAVESIIRQLTDTVVTLDVLQLESTLARSVNTLRSQQRSLQDSLDRYKIFLGLPTDFPLTVDDRLLAPFQFIDPGLIELDHEIEDYVSEWALLDEDDPDLIQSRSYLEGMRELLRRVSSEGADLVRADLDRISTIPIERLSETGKLRLRTDGQRDQRLFDGVVDRLETRRNELDAAEARLKLSEQLSAAAVTAGDPLLAVALAEQAAAVRRDIRNRFNNTRFKLLQDAQSLAAIQIGVRADFITVVPVEISIEDAVAIGLQNRLDLQNARAQVTDAWRNVERTKQLLRSNLDVTVAGTVSGPDDHRPFNFSNGSNTYRFGLQFDTPLDQIDERNAYRNAQVNYQQQRRTYMLAEDNVKQDIRQAWRQLKVLSKNLETGKRAVRINALQYDVAVEQANAPASASSGGQNAGVRGRNLLNALGDVLDSQNALIGIFVNYETNRLTLARDMGTMTIGENGVWEDTLYRRITSGGSFLPNSTEQADEAGSFDSVPPPLGPSSDASELLPGEGVSTVTVGTLRSDPALTAIPLSVSPFAEFVAPR